MKNLGIALLLILVFAIFAPEAGAVEIIGTLDYWESSSNGIASFSGSAPKIYSSSLGGYSLSSLRSRVSNARNQWNNAGIPCTITNSSSLAKIKVYGGTRGEILNVYPGFGPNAVGVTLLSNTKLPGVYLHNGQRKYAYDIIHAKVYVVSGSDYPLNTVIHEIGHSLGWKGHTSTSGNVMYKYESSVVHLTAKDKRHLAQIH